MRLDLLLVARGLATSRERAQAYIMEGLVEVNGAVLIKPGTPVREDVAVTLRPGRSSQFVSRGGLKLEKGLDAFAIDPDGCVAADLGASTGGFTDCLLRRGARRVYAVDVGYGQLDSSLRSDPRVVSLERRNARSLTEEHIPEPVEIVTADLSFISLEKVFPAIRRILKENGTLIALVKPQFEAGRSRVKKGGVVREPAVHVEVLTRVRDDALRSALAMTDLTYSPVRGPAGNIEYLACFRSASLQVTQFPAEKIGAAVDEAHRSFASPR